MDRRAQVKSAFQELVDLSHDERATALDRRVLPPDVRQEVVSLLAAYDAHADFLSTPVSLSALAAPPIPDTEDDGDDLSGQFVGPYLILSLIGAGGMGRVYHAVRADETFDMHVALKVVRRGLDTAEVLRRFREERQTLARLAHPNIAKLLDGGSTEAGQPYFVMEYVRGTRIDRYCREPGLSIPQRLRLFQTVCAAVQYAHQQLVVHRDLKPDNLLVDEDGVPKLLDFGIARVMTPGSDAVAQPTQLIDRRLSLNYASPEHVRGGVVSTTSDVYSLGVILSELLTGHRPYPGGIATVGEFELAMQQGPVAPSKTEQLDAGLRRQLAGDLDTIVLKAVHPDVERRYPSAAQLSDDIGRYLDGRPVQARPDRVGYRTAKFIQRHRLASAAIAVTVVALVGGATATLWQARVAREERDRARVEARRAQVIADFMTGVFASADPQQSGRTITVAEALDQAAARAEEDLAGQPEDLASIRQTIGATYFQLGQIEKAIPLLERALTLRREVSPDSTELIRALQLLGDAYENHGDLTQAEALYREALSTAERLHPGDHHEVASARRYVGSILFTTGKLADAETMNRGTLAMWRRLPDVTPSDLASSINNLAVVLGTAGRWSEAVPLQREALALAIEEHGERHPDVATALSTLATSLEASQEYAEAEPLYLRALALREELLGPDHPGTAFTLYNYATMLVASKQHDKAAPYIQRVRTMRGGALPEGHPLVAGILTLAGQVAIAQNRHADAERDLRDAIQLRSASLPPGHWLLASSAGWLGECLRHTGRYAESERLLLESHDTLTKAFGPDDQRVRTGRARLVALYDAWGRPASAARFRTP